MSNSIKPLVSVIITTYKRPTALDKAINSVLKQKYSSIEVLIVDDNNDNTFYRLETEEVMKKYNNNDKIQYIKHKKNMNGAAARNTGIKNATGKYITFLDDDDEYRNDKVEKQVEFLESHPCYDGVYCAWKKGKNTFLPKYDGDLTFELLSGEAYIITNAIMVTKESAIAIKGFDETFRRNQEAAFLLRFFDAGYLIGKVPFVLFDVELGSSENASNPVQNEKDFDYYLKFHERQVSESAKRSKRNKNIIYSHRYRGVLLTYLKSNDYKGALKVYLKMLRKIPFKFNQDLIIYIFKKIQGKHVYD